MNPRDFSLCRLNRLRINHTAVLARDSRSTMASPATTPRDKQPSSRVKIGPVVLSADSKTAICGVKLTRVRAPNAQTTVASA